MNYDVHVGSQVFIHMPGDLVLSGTLEYLGHVPNSADARMFLVQMLHGGFTANLQPFPVRRRATSNRVDEYRCFILIPISGNRVLSTFLEPRPLPTFVPGTIRIFIRIAEENDTLFAGVMEIGEGEGPEWIPRHI